jgi:hypothetical protein
VSVYDRVQRARATEHGLFTGTTDGSGDVYIGHDLGVTPAVTIVTSAGSACASWYVRARSSTQVQVRCYSASGTLLTSTGVAFDWIVFA